MTFSAVGESARLGFDRDVVDGLPEDRKTFFLLFLSLSRVSPP